LYFPSSSSRSASVPDRSISWMFAAIPLPMPGISSSFFGSPASVLSCTVEDSTASAARRYERMRNGSPALISSRSAVSASNCAMERLSIAHDYTTAGETESRRTPAAAEKTPLRAGERAPALHETK
jgi:hypothetical protein